MADWETTVYFAHNIVFKLSNDYKTFQYTEPDGCIKTVELKHSVKKHMTIIEQHANLLNIPESTMAKCKGIDSFVQLILSLG
jgi:hypothetical protein